MNITIELQTLLVFLAGAMIAHIPNVVVLARIGRRLPNGRVAWWRWLRFFAAANLPIAILWALLQGILPFWALLLTAFVVGYPWYHLMRRQLWPRPTFTGKLPAHLFGSTLMLWADRLASATLALACIRLRDGQGTLLSIASQPSGIRLAGMIWDHTEASEAAEVMP